MEKCRAAGLVFLMLGGPVAAADQAAASALLAQAIRAHGGETALSRTKIMVQKLKGTAFQTGADISLNAELTLRLPDQIRATLEIEANQQKTKTVVVADGDKGWHSTVGSMVEMSKSELQELREDYYVQWLTTLLPLRDKSLRVDLLPVIQIDDRPAVGLKASRTGYPDVKLYFDRRSDLLVKIERKGKFGGLLIDKEYRYDAYQEFEGVKVPTKISESINGKKITDMQLLSIHFPDKVAEGTFAKP